MYSFSSGSLVLMILVVSFLFIITREVNGWYVKINERIRLDVERNALLRELVEQGRVITDDTRNEIASKAQQVEVAENILCCPHCGRDVGDMASRCQYCERDTGY